MRIRSSPMAPARASGPADAPTPPKHAKSSQPKRQNQPTTPQAPNQWHQIHPTKLRPQGQRSQSYNGTSQPAAITRMTMSRTRPRGASLHQRKIKIKINTFKTSSTSTTSTTDGTSTTSNASTTSITSTLVPLGFARICYDFVFEEDPGVSFWEPQSGN